MTTREKKSQAEKYININTDFSAIILKCNWQIKILIINKNTKKYHIFEHMI